MKRLYTILVAVFITLMISLAACSMGIEPSNAPMHLAEKMGGNSTPTTENLKSSVIEYDKETGKQLASISMPIEDVLGTEQIAEIAREEKEKRDAIDEGEVTFRSGFALRTTPGIPEEVSAQLVNGAGYDTYYFIQFGEPVDQEVRNDLEKDGVVFYNYIPNYAFYAKIPVGLHEILQEKVNAGKIRCVGTIPPEARIEKGLLHEAEKYSAAEFNITVQFFEKPDSSQLDAIKGLMQIDAYAEGPLCFVEGNANGDSVQQIRNLNFVKWVEELIPVRITNLEGTMIHGSDIVVDAGTYDGSGIRAAVMDTGIARVGATYHPDLQSSRILDQYDFVNLDTNAADDNGHGTHCAGSLAGGGNRDPEWTGVAPGADLLIYKIIDSAGWVTGSFNDSLTRAAQHEAVISSNSWGGGNNVYTTSSELADKAVRGEYLDSGGLPQYMNLIIAAGNDNNLVHAPGTAKNCITVGAVKDGNWPDIPYTWSCGCTDNIWPPGERVCFSNYGPIDTDGDGHTRVKPDVVSTGPRTMSPYPWYLSPFDYYGIMDGTSQSTPKVAGAVALFLDAHPAYILWPEIVKANMLASTVYLGGSNHYGRGLVDAYHLCYDQSGIKSTPLRVASSVSTTDEEKTYTFTVPSGFEEVRVVLAWADPAGNGVTNDLDLRVYDANNVLRGSSTYNDETAEYVKATTGTAGTWKAVVKAHNLPEPSQYFGLVAVVIEADPDLSFDASSSERYVSKGEYFDITTDLSNAGYTKAATHIGLDMPDAANLFILESVTLYPEDENRAHTYDDSEIYYESTGRTYRLSPGAIIAGYPRHVVWHLRAHPSASDGYYVFYTWGDISSEQVYVDIDSTPPSVTVTSPNGGEVWNVGTKHNITWTATDWVSGVTSIDIHYSTDGGSTYPYTIATGEDHDGVYSWKIPDNPSSTCRVKVVAHDAAGNSGDDASNTNFRIAKPNIGVTPPTFDLMLPPDTTWNGKLTIGDDGGATLEYRITDTETTGGPCFKWVAQDPDPLPSGDSGLLKAEVYDPDGLADIDYVKFWVTQNPGDSGYLYDDGTHGDETAGDGIYTCGIYGTTYYGEELGVILEAEDLAGNSGHTSSVVHIDIGSGSNAADAGYMLVSGSGPVPEEAGSGMNHVGTEVIDMITGTTATGSDPIIGGLPEFTTPDTYLLASAGPIDVLLVAADSTTSVAEVQTYLSSFPDIATVDIFDARYGTPTLSYLQGYDAALVWSRYQFNDPVALGDVLANYVDNGGGVVVGTFSWNPTWDLEGRLADEEYIPFVQAGSNLYSQADMGWYHSSHPIMTGVGSISGYFRDDVALTGCADLIAKWDDNYPFVAEKGPVVGVTLFPGVAYSHNWTGDVPVLIHNSLIWSAEPPDCPWLDENPETGDVEPGNYDEITATIDTTGLALGEYSAEIYVFNNDFDENPTIVPVQLTVAPQIPVGRVLFDESHSPAGGCTIENRFEDWEELLESWGFTVESVTSGTITYDLLDDYCAVVIPEPTVDYSDSEIAAIEQYVNDGGGLLILGEWGPYAQSQGIFPVVNELAAPFGMSFNDDTVYDAVHNDGESWRPLIPNFDSSVAGADVGEVVEYATCTIETDDPAFPIAWTYGTAYTSGSKTSLSDAPLDSSGSGMVVADAMVISKGAGSGAPSDYGEESGIVAGEEVGIVLTTADLSGSDYVDGFNVDETVGGDMYGAQWYALNYTPGISYNLKKIELVAGNGAGKVTVQLRSDDGGMPGSTVLRQVSFAQVNPVSWQGAEFGTSYPLTAGTTYWIVFRAIVGSQASIATSGDLITYVYSSDGSTWSGYYSHPWMAKFCGEEVPVMAASLHGDGRAMVIGDGDLFSNTDWDGDGAISLYEYDNEKLSVNIIGWLCQPMSNCGDVDNNGLVNILDVRLLMNHVADPAGYPVDSWAGNVDGAGGIDMADVQLLVAHVFDPVGHSLKCPT